MKVFTIHRHFCSRPPRRRRCSTRRRDPGSTCSATSALGPHWREEGGLEVEFGLQAVGQLHEVGLPQPLKDHELRSDATLEGYELHLLFLLLVRGSQASLRKAACLPLFSRNLRWQSAVAQLQWRSRCESSAASRDLENVWPVSRGTRGP